MGSGIHHFARDVAELFLEWSPTDLSQCRCPSVAPELRLGTPDVNATPVQIAVSAFINRLIGCAMSTDSTSFRSNRRLILALIATACQKSGLVETSVAMSFGQATYEPSVFTLDLNPLCLMIVS